MEQKRNASSKLLNLSVQPPRTKTVVGNMIINRDSCESIARVDAELLRLQKLGAPEVLRKPTPRKKNDVESETHSAERLLYEESKKAHNLYENPDYTKAHNQYRCYEKLCKLETLLRESQLNKTETSLVVELTNKLSNIVPDRTEDTSDEAYEKNVTKYNRYNFREFIQGVDLTNPDNISQKATELLDNPTVVLFAEKRELSKAKIRVSDYAVIAASTVAETVIRELIEHGVRCATSLEVNSKILRPDHVVTSGVEYLSTYSLFSKLKHYVAVKERQNRRLQYEQDRQLLEAQATVERLKLCLSTKKAFKPLQTEYVSFDEFEHQKGFARRTDKEVKLEKGHVVKPKYEWYGIDVEKESSGDIKNFESNVTNIWKDIKEHGVHEVPLYEVQEIRFSQSMKRFLSNIVIDIYLVLSNMMVLLLDYAGTKTVNAKTVVSTLKFVLSDSMSNEHNDLFNSIEEKLTTKKNYTNALKSSVRV
jgi:histone H3/H4